MKKKLVGLLSIGILSVGGLTAFADTQVENVDGGFARGFGRGEVAAGEYCYENDEYRQERFDELASVLKELGKDELAESLLNGDYESRRDFIDSLTEEEQVELRDAMRESGLSRGYGKNKENRGVGRGRQGCH